MKGRIIIILIILGFANHYVKAQNLATSNPGEYAALSSGNVLINSEVKSESENEAKTASLQESISGAFTKIKSWESKYNSYLQTADGFASSLKAASGIYSDGVRILLMLDKLRQACNNNPQGILATATMNNLYIETAIELLSVFTLLNDAVAKGGKENMLTGSERSKTLWELENRLKELCNKLRKIYYCIKHYTLTDVWHQATAGIIHRDKRSIANQSLSHWKRFSKEVDLTR